MNSGYPVSKRQVASAAKRAVESRGLRLDWFMPYTGDGYAPRPAGYFNWTWRIVDADGNYWGMLNLQCEGGYGAGNYGTGWFKGWVQFNRQDGVPNGWGETLVRQWDFPENGRESAKWTKIRFIEWADHFSKNIGGVK